VLLFLVLLVLVLLVLVLLVLVLLALVERTFFEGFPPGENPWDLWMTGPCV